MTVKLERVGDEWSIRGWGNESVHLTDDELRDLVSQAIEYWRWGDSVM